MILKFRKYRQTKKKIKTKLKKKTKQKTKQKIFSGGASFMPKLRQPPKPPSNGGTGGQKPSSGYFSTVKKALTELTNTGLGTRASVKKTTSSTSQQPTPQQPNPPNQSAHDMIAAQLQHGQ